MKSIQLESSNTSTNVFYIILLPQVSCIFTMEYHMFFILYPTHTTRAYSLFPRYSTPSPGLHSQPMRSHSESRHFSPSVICDILVCRIVHAMNREWWVDLAVCDDLCFFTLTHRLMLFRSHSLYTMVSGSSGSLSLDLEDLWRNSLRMQDFTPPYGLLEPLYIQS